MPATLDKLAPICPQRDPHTCQFTARAKDGGLSPSGDTGVGRADACELVAYEIRVMRCCHVHVREGAVQILVRAGVFEAFPGIRRLPVS